MVVVTAVLLQNGLLLSMTAVRHQFRMQEMCQLTVSLHSASANYCVTSGEKLHDMQLISGRHAGTLLCSAHQNMHDPKTDIKRLRCVQQRQQRPKKQTIAQYQTPTKVWQTDVLVENLP